MDKTKPITCFCTKPWNCGYNEDGRCDFYNESCDKICIAYGGGVPMTNRDASAALGCALQWNGSGQYDHDAAKEAVRVAQAALEKLPQMEEQIRELTKMNQRLERERDDAMKDEHTADAVEVVRCKDCKYGLGRFLNCDGDVEGVWCDHWSKITPVHGYCHEGSKMDMEAQDGNLSQA